jgi:hypothetical protein
MAEEQEKKLTDTATLDTKLEGMISKSLSDAIAAQTGASAQNIAMQIQQSAPFKEIMKQIADEVTQNGLDTQDELIQQELAQQTLADFGSPDTGATTTRHTTTEKPDAKESQVDMTMQQPEDMEIDSLTPEQPAETTPPEETPEEQDKPTEETPPKDEDTSLTDEPSRPSVDDETENKSMEEGDTQTEGPEARKDTTTQNQQQAVDVQQQNVRMQQVTQAMSKQQLIHKLQQLEQRKRRLEIQLLDEENTKKSFGPNQAALFFPIITTLLYFVDLLDVTEFIAPFLDFIYACVYLYWKMTRPIRLKTFYLKRLPEFLFARFLGCLPFISYLAPEVLQEAKNKYDTVKEYWRAKRTIPNIKKQIEHIEEQIKLVKKQLSRTSSSSFMQKAAHSFSSLSRGQAPAPT